MICLNCGTGKAQIKPPFGVLPCKSCTKRQKQFKIGQTIELTTDTIREDRNKFAADIEQRYDGDVPNLNYINKYGIKGYSPDELKKARARHGTYYRDSMERYNPKAKKK